VAASLAVHACMSGIYFQHHKLINAQFGLLVEKSLGYPMSQSDWDPRASKRDQL